MKRILLTLLLVAGLGLSTTAAQENDNHLPARVTLKKGQPWKVTLLGRFVADRVLMKKTGESGTIDLPISEIARIEFAPSFNAANVLDAYHAGRYSEVAPALEKGLQPYRKYVMDAACNLDPLFEAEMKSWYWSDNLPKAITSSQAILDSTTSGDLRTEALSIRVLALVKTRKLDEAATTAKTLPSPAPRGARPPSALYALAHLHMATNDLHAAQESLARLISFHARDLEWMPAALLLSAEGYARAGDVDVAQQIVDELKLNYPATPWITRADELDIMALRPLAADPP